MKIKNKKGDAVSPTLVAFIVLIVSFVIILFLIFRLNLGGTTDKEICRNSVFLRDKASVFSGPLNCKTNYLCISGGDDCRGTTSEKIKVNPENKEEIMKAIADEMSDCWWQFGEGKLNYGISGDVSIKYALCSFVEFDSNVQKKIPEITYPEFYDYLRKTPKDSSQTYLKYLYDAEHISQLKVQSQFEIDTSQDRIRTNKKYSIITGIDDNNPTPDEILNVYIIPTSETSSRLKQGEFITKA